MPVKDKRLGRLIIKDERDKNFPMKVPSEVSPELTMRYWYSPGVLDQGYTAMCVAYSRL